MMRKYHVLSETEDRKNRIDALCRQLHIGRIELRGMELDEKAVYMVSEAMARKYVLIPVGFKKGSRQTLQVAMENPVDLGVVNDLEIITSLPIEPLLSEKNQIAFQIDRYFGKQSVIAAAEEYKREYGSTDTSSEEEEDTDSPIVKMVRFIMEQAVRQRASDIHFEPLEDGVRIRFRIDGDLMEAMTYDASILAPLIARIKIISGMDITEKRKAQEGRTSIVVDNEAYDIRVSSVPTVYGEKAVMRLNNKISPDRDKRELGMRDEEIVLFEKMLSRPHGLILVTGPTGSGKSTTLYTALSQLNRENVNIVTIEDPVEAVVPGVNQIQVNWKTGMTFARTLRWILRQDPDIIMIGEIRDGETAQIAVQAAITGHLVVSTLHTNSTQAAVSRMVNMGVRSYLAADALAGIAAQRLCRCLCSCKEGRPATQEEKDELGVKEKTLRIFEPKGCPLCNYTGYYGRTGVFEVMPVNQVLRDKITRMEPAFALREQAVADGMRTLKENAAQLVIDGITSLSEMRKIIWEEDF